LAGDGPPAAGAAAGFSAGASAANNPALAVASRAKLRVLRVKFILHGLLVSKLTRVVPVFILLIAELPAS
jgi:hypothetical protein